jgi:hypothetical protein
MKKYIFRAVFPIAVIVCLYSCTTIVPMTERYANDVGGEQELIWFRFYSSARIVLTKVVEKNFTPKSTPPGRVKNTDDTVLINPEVIIIEHETTGRLKSIDRYDTYNVGFEWLPDLTKRGSVPTLEFRQKMIGPDEYYYLCYENYYPYRYPHAPGDEHEKIIKYNGDIYRLRYEGDEEPHLKVAIDRDRWNGIRVVPGIR